MADIEEEERDAGRNTNNVTMDTFSQPPVPINTQRKIANVPNERQIASKIMSETIKRFKVLTVQSKINDSEYYNSDEDDAESDPNSGPKVANQTSDGKKINVTDTDTNNRNYSQKLLINGLIPEITAGVIPPINNITADGVKASGRTLHAQHTIILKEITMDAARSAARFFKDPLMVNWKDMDGTISRDRNDVGTSPYLILYFGLVLDTLYTQLA